MQLLNAVALLVFVGDFIEFEEAKHAALLSQNLKGLA